MQSDGDSASDSQRHERQKGEGEGFDCPHLDSIAKATVGFFDKVCQCCRIGILFNFLLLITVFTVVGWLLDDIFFSIFKIKMFTTYLVCELYFIVYYRWKRREIQAFVNIEPLTKKKRGELMREWISVITTIGQDVLTGWFFGAKLSDIRKENLVQFLTWALFNTTPPRLTPEQVYIDRLD
mmetsp:Transcript_24687/g.43883  ORF Transcript_24687/g.43883 Transcript_24687/m.43883 type:complete len:181 (-) Transcript_24687:119-661(-)